MAARSIHELDLPSLRDTGVGALDPAAIQASWQHHWLSRTPLGFAVTRHEDVFAVLRDRRFHSASSRLAKMPGDDEDYLGSLPRSLLSMDGNEHSRLRRLVSPAFTPKAADRLRPYMREVINALVDSVAASGRCEFVGDLCDPYPVPIICRLLGAPTQDSKIFSQWATDIHRKFNNNLAADLPVIRRATEELKDYVRAMIDERRTTPTNDLISELIAVEEQGDRLSTEELVTMAELILMAGTDTTRNQLACSVAVLAEHPDQWALLGQRPELAAQAVDETMRHLGALRGTLRFAAEDIEYRDVLFPRGTLLWTSAVGANMDPSVWEAPETFDITQKRSIQHLTFGSGIHYCLGASLARAELQEALALLARRMPGLTLDGPVDWQPSNVGIWGPARLRLRFQPDVRA
ncbi:cytochrome P450 [Frankia gtarii]|uniref:cytochrome P450 n=1 Tax=Frankia gtarii TaxID=2950102 RepID=UPI0021BFD141|nr:cytochrome P450 [Frankia gtarii]